ncbi:MAG: hypothetical protein IKD09_00610 [Lentisphaeria bacterium]|nr:hypothetical protein [Lentisphaeria bacterium]
MLTMIIAVSLGIMTFYSTQEEWGNTWAIISGIVVVMLAQLAIGLFIRSRINKITGDIQDIMVQTQNKINRQINIMQYRQLGNPKSAQQLLTKEQNNALRKCLEITERANKYFIWNVLLKKQIISMRMMLYFQMKEFKKVDELMPKALIFDARSVAVKGVRMYKNKDEKVVDYLTKKAAKFKNDDAVLIYSLLAWILVKQNKVADAAKLLAEAKNKVDNQVINDNYERLANGKEKHFSNAQLGDIWYSLYLEEPKIKQQKMQQRGF